MYYFVQTSLEVERKPQRRREKSKAHPLFLHHRKAQTQEKKGNKASVSVSSTLNECGERSDIFHVFLLLQLLQQQHQQQERDLRRHARLVRQHFPSRRQHQRPHPGQVPRDVSQRAADRR